MNDDDFNLSDLEDENKKREMIELEFQLDN